MSKFSVKKPLTVFVAVIAVLVLGVVAYLRMTPDLFPNMDFPYVMIMTTYPGASPEKVEQEITKPLEQSMSTLEHIKQVSSTSGENYSMVMLEFEEAVNLDTIGVDIQQNISTLSSQWDDMVGVPYVLKINPSMLPVEVAAVSMEGMDTVALTQFLDETLMNKLEGIAGVAQISASGSVTQQLHIVLDQKKLDALNATIADTINQKMDEALEELTAQKEQLQTAQTELENAKAQLETGKDALAGQTGSAGAEINYQQGQLIATKAQLSDQLTQLQSGKQQLEMMLSVLTALRDGIAQLRTEADGLQKDLDDLLALQQTADELAQAGEAFREELEKLQNDPSMDPQQIQAAIDALKATQEYQQWDAAMQVLKAELAARGLDEAALRQQIEQIRTALTNISARLESAVASLSELELNEKTLEDKIAELQNNLTQIDTGAAALSDAIAQVDAGILQLKDASAVLEEQKASGLLELSSAATEITVNAATVSGALQQLEAGLETLEQSRKDALAQADLGNILTMDMVSSLLTAQNFSMPAGYLQQDGINYMVSVGDVITTQEELEDLLLFDMHMEGIEPIYLTDVASVMLTDNRDETYARLNGNHGVVLSFQKQSSYATAETTNNIAARFRELEAEYPGLEFVALMDQGDYIYLIVDTILNSLLLGALFAVLILFLFLRDLRPTFITLCSIPISVIFAIVLMYFSGVTINIISLSGLAVAVGMLVDNSVVVIENIYRLRAKGANVIQAAVSGARQVAGAVTASTLTTICVFLPIVFIEGITKQLFTDLALTMTYALLASLIVSLTLVPAMASGMLRKEKVQKHAVFDKLLKLYQRSAHWCLDHKPVVIISAAVLLVVSGVLSVIKGFTFMPTIDMPNVNVSISMPEDVKMEEATALADEVLTRIETVDGIATVGAMMSSGTAGLMGGGSDSFDVTVYITLADEEAKGSQVGKQIESLCADLPCTVTSSSAMMDMNMLTGSGISLEIYADDIQLLQDASREAARVLESVDGITTVSDGLEDTAPALHISIDRNAAMAKGITVAQIYMELAADLQTSTTVATLQLSGTSTEVILEKPEESALTIAQLTTYPLSVTGQDGTVTEFTLGEVAVVEETTSLNSIQRQDQRRYLNVTAEVAEGENVTLVNARAERAMKSADLGDGVTYAFTGENETIMEAVEQLLLMLVLGVLLVYLVMVAQFQNLKSPFIVMFTIPLAFTGGFLALLICGMEISVISLIGFVMLTGIIVNNGIVLVDYINQLRLEGAARRDAIVEAGSTRMRPILMTTLTTILGLIDMATNTSAGTTLMQPVAVVCIGGLAYATLMTLYVVPCIYDIFCKKELRNVREEDLKLLDI